VISKPTPFVRLPLFERRWNIALFSAVAALCLALMILMGRSVLTDLETVSKARHDDISWNMAQIEVELLRVQTAALKTQASDGASLVEFRRRYDIFYSRIQTVRRSLRARIQVDDADFTLPLSDADRFLARTTPIVDSDDATLRAALPDLIFEIGLLRVELRQMALSGVSHYAQKDAARRDRIEQTLLRLAGAALGLITALLVLILVLVRLYQRGARIFVENQVINARFEATVHNALDAVVVADMQGKIIEFNAAAEQLFGYGRADVVGQRHIDQLFPDAMRGPETSGVAARLRGRILHASDKSLPVEYSISLTETEHEQVAVYFLRDITVELDREQALRDARDTAQAGEKAKSDLLTVMSHEMRTPLNGILGTLSVFERDNLTPRQLRHLGAIAVSGELLMSHVNNVLSLSSIEADSSAQEAVTFDLAQVVERLVQSLTASAQERGNTLSLDLQIAQGTQVTGRKTALQQCLVNLIGNAIKFTRDGTISVELEWLDHQNLFEFRVADTGTGIAEDQQERIFDEFVMVDTRYDRETAGTGLGLPITRRMAQSMGGDVEVQSILGEGSLFTLQVPLLRDTAAPEPAPQPDPQEEPYFTPGKARVLVVDDNEINRMILVDMLSDLGIGSEEAHSGYVALDILAKQAFDLVLLDISMPGIDGLETLSRLRELDVAWCEIPAIAVTALASQEDRQHIMQSDFHDILTKPVDQGALRRALTSVLNVASDTAKPKAQASSFRQRFGDARADRALATFAQELTELRAALQNPDSPQVDVIKQAHHLAGSAGVLELMELMACLQRLEVAPASDWPALAAELENLSVTF
jgi:PAS domain S-box-containing protein